MQTQESRLMNLLNVETVQVASCACVSILKTLSGFIQPMIREMQTVQVGNWLLVTLLKTLGEFIKCVCDVCCILQRISDAR